MTSFIWSELRKKVKACAEVIAQIVLCAGDAIINLYRIILTLKLQKENDLSFHNLAKDKIRSHKNRLRILFSFHFIGKCAIILNVKYEGWVRNLNKIKLEPRYKAIFYIILSAFCFAFMNLFVRLSGDLPSMQKCFFRNFVAVFFALGVLMKNKSSLKWKKGNLKFLLLRSAVGTLGIVGNFYAIDHIALADASILNKMSPFFVIIFSLVLLKEKLTFLQGAAVFIAFIGTLFVVKPTFQNIELIPSAVGLIGGMCAGFAYTMVRILGQRGENGSLIVFFFSGFSCITMLPFLIFDYHPMEWWQLLMLLGAGLSATGGQFSITAAYCYAPAREISVYDYSQIIFATLLGFIFLGEIPDIYSVVGYIVISSMAILMFMYNNNKGIFKNRKHIKPEINSVEED